MDLTGEATEAQGSFQGSGNFFGLIFKLYCDVARWDES